MTLLPDPWWLPAILAAIVFVDAMVSLRPPKPVRDCLDGVNFPRDWWWTLVVIKLTAAAGLLMGMWYPGVGLAANVGMVIYLLCAVVAHLRARFLGTTLWINCLGMLALTLVSLVFAFLV